MCCKRLCVFQAVSSSRKINLADAELQDLANALLHRFNSSHPNVFIERAKVVR